MTFLYGQTTQAGLQAKIMALISGQSADDHGVTVPSANQWRTNLTGTGDSGIAPPASQDETVTQQHRAGYWARVDDACLYNDKTASGKAFCQQTAIWNAWHANFSDSLIVSIQVTTANTVAGNYSTARVTLWATGISKATTSPFGMSATVLTPAADGTVTWTYTTGYAMTFKIGDASTGIVPVGTTFLRNYQSAFRGGFDIWRRAGRNIDGVFTFGTAPSGVAGTDYAVNAGPNHFAFPSPSAAWGGNFYQYWVGSSYNIPWTSMAGLGIKTNAGLTGALYVVTFTKQECVLAISSGTSTLNLVIGGVGQSPDGTTKHYGQDGSWNLGCSFLPHGAAASTSVVQYWINVTATHLAIVLNADTGASWRTSANMVAKITADDPSYGVGWLMGVPGNQNWQRIGTHVAIEMALNKGAGYHDNGRDWQIGQGRFDTFPMEQTQPYWSGGEYGASWYVVGGTTGPYIASEGSFSSSSQYSSPALSFQRDRATLPLLVDPTWQLAGLLVYDGLYQGVMTTDSNNDTAARRVGTARSRGYVAEGLWQCSLGGYNQGDELTDSVTGEKFLLWQSSAYTFPWGMGGQAAGFALSEA